MRTHGTVEQHALDLIRTHGNDAWFHAAQAADAALADGDADGQALWSAVLKRIAAIERMSSGSLIQ